MSEVLQVPAGGDARSSAVTVKGTIRHLCPFVGEADYGRISITWLVDETTFELHELAEYLESFRSERISHEDLTGRILEELSPLAVAVTTYWTTAGLEVAVSRSRLGGAS